MILYYKLVDKKVFPSNQEDFLYQLEHSEMRRIAYTKLIGIAFVSTVFLGLPPEDKFFETLVCFENCDQTCVHYRTYEEALDGHFKIVEKIKNREELE